MERLIKIDFFEDIGKTNWQLFFSVIIAVLIPTNINLFPIVLLWVSVWIYTKSYKGITLKSFPFWFYVIELFYLLHLISFFYSEDKDVALSNIHLKFGFFFFPFLLTTYNASKKDIKTILLAFCFSNIVIAAFLLGRMLFYYFVLHEGLFSYYKFSIIIHPIYASMFMVFSIIILFITDFNLVNNRNKNYFIKALLLFFLISAIMFSSSKIGIITHGIVFVFIIIYYLIKLKEIKYSIIGILIFGALSFILIKNVPSLPEKFEEGITALKNYNHTDKQAASSSSARILIWNTAFKVICKHPVFGVGIGDVNDSLFQAYDEEYLYNLLIKRYNAHNQYMETLIGIGIVGVFPLFMLTVGMLISAIFRYNLIVFIFCLIIILNFLVESVLQWEIGSVFLSFFLCILIKDSKDIKIVLKNESSTEKSFG